MTPAQREEIDFDLTYFFGTFCTQELKIFKGPPHNGIFETELVRGDKYMDSRSLVFCIKGALTPRFFSPCALLK